MRAIISAIVVGLLLSATTVVFAEETKNLNPVVWTVNGQPIHAVEISMMMQNFAAQAQQMGQEPDEQKILEIATQRVIERKLLVQEAQRYAIKPDEAKIAAMTQQMEQQAGGRERLDQILSQGGASYEDAVNSLSEMILVMQLVDTQIAPAIKVSDEEIGAFFENNNQAFTTDEQVRARHIIFKVAQDADEAAVTEARQKTEKARERALAGEDFAALATELSEGPSAPKGGDLGFFSREQMVPEFADAAFALEPGAISEVIRTSYGFHVIKTEEHRDAAKQSLDEVKEGITGMLRQQKVSDAIDGLLETLTASAEIKPMAEPAPATD